jgi:hypothetical protein
MAQEQQQSHKTNRDWHLDTSSSDHSNNTMNMEEDSDTSDTTRLTSNNANENNNHIITRDDYNETDYEATDPDNFKAKITDIASWTHDDLVHNTVPGVNTFMTYWHLHSYHWYCYNCNQQLVSTGTDTWELECPTQKNLEASQGDNEAHWDFGVCGRCNNIGPAEMTCVTCFLNQGNMNTYAALIKTMKMYQNELTLLPSPPQEFVVLANYYHYLQVQCLEVDNWNHLKWYEYYENSYAAIQSHPLKMVTWKCLNQYCNGPESFHCTQVALEN